MATESQLSVVRAAVRRYDRFLLENRNVNGVGVGLKIVHGHLTDTPCLRIYVSRKRPREAFQRDALLPAFVDAGGGEKVVTDIVEAGPFYLEDSPRVPPAQPGIGIQPAPDGTPGGIGTFGAVVVDDMTDKSLILSNNHVMADNNINPPGTPILQPGRVSTGTLRDYTIATLLRFVWLQQRCDNLVDCALALPVVPSIISVTPLDGVPAPSPNARAVALHFAGGPAISVGNPIETVLAQLAVHFPHADSTIGATLDMAVQKIGRTTGRTTGKVDAMNVTIVADNRTFINQIAFSRMTESGDSGSLYVQDHG
jgi:hypothetical protein